jgi:hypothetical protein
MPARARAANDLPTSGPPKEGSGDTMMESVFARIRTGEILSSSQARWIRDTYSCIHCFSKTHGTESCHKLANLYKISKKPGGDGRQRPTFTPRGPRPPTPGAPAPASGGVGRQATQEPETKHPSNGNLPATASALQQKTTPRGESSRNNVAAKVSTVEDDDSKSIADESDDMFATYDTIATTDKDLVHSLAQTQARCTAAKEPALTAPIPISSRIDNKTTAKLAKADLRWLKPEKGKEGGRGVHWDSNIIQALTY